MGHRYAALWHGEPPIGLDRRLNRDDESAGKQRSGKTRRGNRTLRTGLTQLAHAAVHTKGTSMAAFYQRLAARRGK